MYRIHTRWRYSLFCQEGEWTVPTHLLMPASSYPAVFPTRQRAPSVINVGRRIQEGITGAWLRSSFFLLFHCLAADWGKKEKKLGFHGFSHASGPRKWPRAGNQAKVSQSHIPMASKSLLRSKKALAPNSVSGYLTYNYKAIGGKFITTFLWIWGIKSGVVSSEWGSRDWVERSLCWERTFYVGYVSIYSKTIKNNLWEGATVCRQCTFYSFSD